MKARVLKTYVIVDGMGYRPGDEISIPKSELDRLVKKGIVEAVTPEKPAIRVSERVE